jgi:hypothetical protein
LEYDATLDGEAVLSIRANEVRVVTGAPRNAKPAFSRPIPAVELTGVAVAAVNGNAEVLAEPSAANGFATIVRVRSGGQGRVRFRLDWAE